MSNEIFGLQSMGGKQSLSPLASKLQVCLEKVMQEPSLSAVGNMCSAQKEIDEIKQALIMVREIRSEIEAASHRLSATD